MLKLTSTLSLGVITYLMFAQLDDCIRQQPPGYHGLLSDARRHTTGKMPTQFDPAKDKVRDDGAADFTACIADTLCRNDALFFFV